jgi:hypothetical protein
MKENSRIRFNPVTGEIEVEGTEAFVKDYFQKLQAMIAAPGEKTAAPRQAPKTVKAVGKKKAGQALPTAKRRKDAKPLRKPAKRPVGEKITQFDLVLGIVRESAEGISTEGLMEKTGLSKNQLWNIVNRATKAGQIRKLKRGLYAAGNVAP